MFTWDLSGYILKISNPMLLTALLLSVPQPLISSGKLIDAVDKQPIAGAMIYSSVDTVYSALDGSFCLKTTSEGLTVKYVSYQQSTFLEGGLLELYPLKPETVAIKSKK